MYNTPKMNQIIALEGRIMVHTAATTRAINRLHRLALLGLRRDQKIKI
jgi:hypothetical protein